MFAEAAPTLAIAALATAGVLVRPWRLPEYAFALTGAAALVAFKLLPPQDAFAAVLEGTDVYLFLVGMMLLAEVARQEGLFDWTAVRAVRAARGSQHRLFALVYGVGTLVTIFLSNDATAVVLTPAVYAAARAARVEPLPYLFACAFVANAASFALPISNPANLVIFGAHMPPLAVWLATFAPSSLAAIVATFCVLRFTQRRSLASRIPVAPDDCGLSPAGRLVGVGLIGTAAVLVCVSFLGRDLGAPTLACGLSVAAAATIAARRSPMRALRHVAWGVLPLVAGLFVLVEGLAHAGVIRALAGVLREGQAAAPATTTFGAGVVAGLVANVVNNLPLGLVAASAGQAAPATLQTTAGLLIGVDLGPNLSVTGSLATLLWLIAIRREGAHVGAARFLKLGALVMPPALVLALIALVAI